MYCEILIGVVRGPVERNVIISTVIVTIICHCHVKSVYNMLNDINLDTNKINSLLHIFPVKFSNLYSC